MDDDLLLQLLHDIRQSPAFFFRPNRDTAEHTSQGETPFHRSKTKVFTISLNSHQYGSKQNRATSATGVGGPCSIGP